jgi:hypothetical protein
VHWDIVDSAILEVARTVEVVEKGNVMRAAEEGQGSNIKRWIKTVAVNFT